MTTRRSHMLLALVMVLLTSVSFASAASLQGVSVNLNPDSLTPSVGPDLLDRARTANFIRSTQNTDNYNSSNLDNIYYRLGAIKLLDDTLASVSQFQKNLWRDQILTFQNLDGGFGHWIYDQSSLSSTRKAVEILSWLGSLSSINTTHTGVFLDSLRNQLTSGFNSHNYDSDADVYTSSLGVESYDILGLAISNQTDIENLFIRAQNDDNATSDYGGFGKQTNNIKLIFWTSKASISRAAINSLNILGASANNSIAIDFIRSLQLSEGGFANDLVVASPSITYTASSLEALGVLGVEADDPELALAYIANLESADGGYKYNSISTKSSLKATFFALRGLKVLSVATSNPTLTLAYLNDWTLTSGGYGAAPGEAASLRETFDAVSALVMMDRTPVFTQRIVDFVASYRRVDGGYGLTGSFVESTLRVTEIYNLLGVAYPDPASTISFLQGLQQADGGFSKGEGKTFSYVISTYRAVRALELLGALPSSVASAVNYLKSSFDSTSGGFKGYFTDIDADITSTYRAVRALTIMGDTSFDKTSVTNFVKNSQNLDGGFKRSNYNDLRPYNISNAVYTYSALRTLQILDDVPLNVSGVYNFVTSLRNRDGGYAEHPQFTSDISYTFTSIWILANLNDFVKFSIDLPAELEQLDTNDRNFTLGINGALTPIIYNVSLVGSSTVISGSLQDAGDVVLDLPILLPGAYQFSISAIDLSGQTINEIINVNISPADDPTIPATLPSEIPSELSSLLTDTNGAGMNWISSMILLGSSFLILISLRRRR